MDPIEFVKMILVGLGAGFFAAFVGYFKGTKLENFDGPKFLTTVLLGAVLGGIGGGMGISIAEVEIMLQTMCLLAGLTYVVENVAKLIWRRIRDYFKSPA